MTVPFACYKGGTMEQDYEEQKRQLATDLSQAQVARAETKKKLDIVVRGIFFLLALICSCVIIFIVIFILIKGIQPFTNTYVSPTNPSVTGSQNFGEFFTLTTWNGGEFSHGAGYLVVNTLYVTALSLIISIPVSIMTSLLITRIAPKPLAAAFQTGIELLASIPSVIFGLFGMGIITGIVKAFAEAVGYQTAGGSSMLAGVFVLAIMSIPTMTSMSVTAMKSVDPALIKASMALGASKTQTDFKIVIKDSSSGIFAGIILGIGRALGEATAIQMVIGNAMSGPTLNPLDISATLTTQMLMGIGEATVGTMGYDIRFSAAILLMLVILIIDVFLNMVNDEMYARRTGQQSKSFFAKLWRKIHPEEKKNRRSLKSESEEA